MLLTIAILTFNRPGLCLDQVKSVFYSLVKYDFLGEVEIIVLNNSSTENYHQVERFCSSNQIKYHLSAANLGFNGNYCRAVCSGHGKYLWVASDDDIISGVAIYSVLTVLRSAMPPEIISFSHYIGNPVFTGRLSDYIDLAFARQPLALSEFTLVTNLIYKRTIFDWFKFWKNEPLWFPHAYATVGNCINADINIVVFGSKKLVYQSGNTEQERAINIESNYNKMLNSQFQRAVLSFINMFRLESHLHASAMSDEQYVELVCSTFGSSRASILKGMNHIELY